MQSEGGFKWQVNPLKMDGFPLAHTPELSNICYYRFNVPESLCLSISLALGDMYEKRKSWHYKKLSFVLFL